MEEARLPGKLRLPKAKSATKRRRERRGKKAAKRQSVEGYRGEGERKLDMTNVDWCTVRVQTSGSSGAASGMLERCF